MKSPFLGNPLNQQLAKGVQAAANVAAAAAPRLEDVTVGSQCLRTLFERLRVAQIEVCFIYCIGLLFRVLFLAINISLVA